MGLNEREKGTIDGEKFMQAVVRQPEPFYYDGSFVLDWLAPDEWVAGAGDGSGAAVIGRGDRSGEPFLRVEIGDVLVREVDGSLTVRVTPQ